MPKARTTFFRQQERAKSSTFLLLFLFTGGVAGTILSVYLGIRLLIGASTKKEVLELFGAFPTSLDAVLHDPVFIVTSAVTLVFVLLGSLFQIISLLRNEDKILTLMNARAVPVATPDAKERQLRNVVEEMAIAAGLPAPRIFIMPDEAGINAFASGRTAEKASIAVTRGCLERLSRDELQAVIGHEFSHILNGDAGLNIQLLGWLHGLFVIMVVGRILTRESDSKNGLLVFGLMLLVVGSIGWFFGRLVKAMISREREYLADASSVQLTRNPDALHSALKKVGNDDGGSAFVGWLDSHPLLLQRLAAFEAVGATVRAENAKTPPPPKTGIRIPPPFNPSTASGLAMAAASTIASRVGTVRPANLAAATRTIETLPKEIDELRGTPEGAHALCAVLLADSGSLSADSFEPKVAALLGPARAAVRQPGISLTQKVISLNLALPSLSSLSTDAKEGLLATLRVIALQGSEWFPPFDAFILLTLLRAQLLTARRNTGKLNDPDTRIFLSLVAAQAGDSPKRVESFAKSTAFMGKTLMGSIHPGAFRLDAVWEAIDRLRAEAPAVREKMINAMEIAVLADNAVTESEEQLLRMLCLISGCPVPLSISCGDSADPVASRP